MFNLLYKIIDVKAKLLRNLKRIKCILWDYQFQILGYKSLKKSRKALTHQDNQWQTTGFIITKNTSKKIFILS